MLSLLLFALLVAAWSGDSYWAVARRVVVPYGQQRAEKYQP